MSEYEAIDCGLHDVVEDRIVRRVVCEVLYRAENGREEQHYQGRLMDVFGRDGAEFVALQDGILVRLDRVLKVDDVEFR